MATPAREGLGEDGAMVAGAAAAVKAEKEVRRSLSFASAPRLMSYVHSGTFSLIVQGQPCQLHFLGRRDRAGSR